MFKMKPSDKWLKEAAKEEEKWERNNPGVIEPWEIGLPQPHSEENTAQQSISETKKQPNS